MPFSGGALAADLSAEEEAGAKAGEELALEVSPRP